MPMPYKEVGPAFMTFIQHIEDMAKQTAMTSNPNVGEGKQDAPVGTTLALLEQASKVISSAFKRLHMAQLEEFQLLKERFREDPEAMWRHNKRPAMDWQRDQFLQALNKYELVPCADPNSPTSLHRVMKAMAVKQLQSMNPQLYDPVAVDKRIMSVIGIDPEGLFKPPPPPGQQQQPDPMMMMMQMRMRLEELKVQAKEQELQLKKELAELEKQNTAIDVQGKQRIEMIKQKIAQDKNERDYITDRLKIVSDEIMHHHEMMGDEAQRQHESQMAQREHETTMAQANMQHQTTMAQTHLQHQTTMAQGQMEHQNAMQEGEMEHRNTLAQGQQQQAHESQMAQGEHEHEARQGQMEMRHTAREGEKDRASTERQSRISAAKSQGPGSAKKGSKP